MAKRDCSVYVFCNSERCGGAVAVASPHGFGVHLCDDFFPNPCCECWVGILQFGIMRRDNGNCFAACFRFGVHLCDDLLQTIAERELLHVYVLRFGITGRGGGTSLAAYLFGYSDMCRFSNRVPDRACVCSLPRIMVCDQCLAQASCTTTAH